MQARVVRVSHQGEPDCMEWVEVELPAPGLGEVLIRHTAVGVNYVDTMQRSGLSPLTLPSGLGHEAAGIITATGPDSREFAIGDRVLYPSAGLGAYATARIVRTDRVVRLPATMSDVDAVALVFKGLTAWYLLHRTHPIAPGDVVVVHSAAGGVGRLLAAWSRALGAVVIGTVGGDEKRQAAIEAGCVAVHVRNSGSRLEDVVRAAAAGRKARVVYDAVGRATFDESIDALAPFGLLASYGSASGPVPPVDVNLLNRKGCLFLTRPSIFPHIAGRASLEEGMAALFQAVADGILTSLVANRLPLRDVAEAHRQLEAGTTVGAMVLVVP